MQLIVDGMTCDHCVRSITKAIQAIDAQARVDVDLPRGTVTIDGKVDAGRATSAIEAEGYRVTYAAVPNACCGGCRA
jgi:copper chaperone CopZ